LLLLDLVGACITVRLRTPQPPVPRQRPWSCHPHRIWSRHCHLRPSPVNNTRAKLFFKSSRLSPSASLSIVVGTPPCRRRPPRGASHRRMPLCRLPSATPPTLDHCGEPLPPSCCPAPPPPQGRASPTDASTPHPPHSHHRPRHRTPQ
jgi:hypothetical protein